MLMYKFHLPALSDKHKPEIKSQYNHSMSNETNSLFHLTSC